MRKKHFLWLVFTLITLVSLLASHLLTASSSVLGIAAWGIIASIGWTAVVAWILVAAFEAVVNIYDRLDQ